jgi:serine/threonine-protein kinase
MERVGPYRVVRVLESSGASEVLLATDDRLDQTVVLKRLVPSARTDSVLVQRLTREARAYARLVHPAIVRMLNFIEYEGLPVLVLELVDGPSLEQVLISLGVRKQKLARGAAYHVGAGIYGGLAAMHAMRDPDTNEPAPFMHRDMSPGNVLITRTGDVKLADLGFARAVGKSNPDTSRQQKGSMGYMAPEQVHMQEITPRTDVYGAGLLLYEMLTGAPPFPTGTGVTHGERVIRMGNPKLAPIEQACPDIPSDLADALMLALRPKVEDRAISAADMGRILDRLAVRLAGRDELTRLLGGFERSS